MSKPVQVGHAGNDLRYAFCTLVETGAAKVAVGEQKQTRKWVIGQLWHCTDIMPSAYCDDLGLVPGSNYAQGARQLKRKFKAA